MAIVGRPNVGKSTLFNRLLGRRQAIVDDLPGTTRDRLEAEVSWGDRTFLVVDTGGLEPGAELPLAARVREQVEQACAEADVVLFLVDGKEGLVSTDLEIASFLRRLGKPVVLGVNKVDSERREQEVFQFYELGLGDPFPLSAYHSIGVASLMEAVLAYLPPSAAEELPQGDVIKLAIVGRPNVGKSMLLNAMLGEERVIVDEKPGTTRDAIDTPFSHNGHNFILIDTAGIRRRGRVETGVEKYSVLRAFQAIRRADVALLVLDAVEGVAAQDSHILGFIQEHYKGAVIVVNKWDLARERDGDTESYTGYIREKLRFMPYAPVAFTSAKLREGVERVLNLALLVFEERGRRLPTSQLNRVVQEAVASHSAPQKGGRRLHILYATQAEVNPPTFVFFVNEAKLLTPPYRRFLENRLREAGGFSGTPLKLVFRGRGEG